MIFGSPQEAATMAYLKWMVLRGAAPQRGAKKHAALRVGLKCPVCFVVGSRRLISKSRLDPPPRIRDISDPSQSRPLLGQAPSNNVITIRRNENDTGQIRLNSVLVPYKPHEQS